MEKHSCKLCFKSFASGRALGGHMRSHMVTLSTPPKTQQIHPHQHQHLLGDETESASSASSSSSSSSGEEEEEEKGLYYGLRENPRKSFRLVDPEFSFVVDAGSVVQDRESETESSKNPSNPSKRRSKRDRKSTIIGEQRNLQHQQQPQTPELKKTKSTKLSKTESPPEPEPVSSVSDTTPEEDVARCLMMLSRDIWLREEEEVEEEDEEEEEAEKSMEESDASEELKYPTRTRGRYQCGTCKKVFRSYQALGGHRASHKKIKGCIPSSSARTLEAEYEPGNAGTSTVDRRIHECPVCFRIFGSGQALGGHKRSHLSGSTTATNTVKFGDNLIDLNLPAPIDDDDMSQVELSAVSDAEFVDPTK
ncbi:hypothetical protein NE237_030100 [Protea cynaroides]|uniref:C2H2-type domain-containing protein n=1 Tax=Protea cynaroides TaxID=273540 RepID=A0A9Q0JWX2_9MAGN|nr:hypothetical protein NE237_030100 [Protea cynaroides]